jgi:hypothetical protein
MLGVCVTTVNKVKLSVLYVETFEHGSAKYPGIIGRILSSTRNKSNIHVKIAHKYHILAKSSFTIPPRSLTSRRSSDMHMRPIYGTCTLLQ